MQRQYVKWWSPSLGREIEMLVFGYSGTPVLVFPSSMGRFHEWEDFKMIEACAHQIGSGFNQFFCVDSVDSESFYNKFADPYVRIMRHRQYDSYIIDEVVPFIRTNNPNPHLISTGASFGAYHALNVAFKYPNMFHKLIAMSGKYDIRNFMHGFYDDNVYFNNPIDYIPQMHDHHHLEAMRRMDIRLLAGEHDICRQPTEDMSWRLNSKSVHNTLDIWGNGTAHDWPWWRNMITKHIP